MAKPKPKASALKKTSTYLRPETAALLRSAAEGFEATQVDFLEQAIWHLADELGLQKPSIRAPCPRKSIRLHEAMQGLRG